MSTTRYYTLVASLPALPYFERAPRVPINRVRLDQRLRMLTPEDTQELRRCERLIAWRSHDLSSPAAAIAGIYERLRAQSRYPSVLAYVDHRLQMRTVISALRARRLGTPLSELERPWGLGELVPVIERRWDVADFGLAARLPWVPHLRECIERGEALELGRAVFEREWKFLVTVADAHPFAFPEVLSYVMRRDIIERWLRRDADVARRRFSTLTQEAFDERARLPFG